MTDKDIEIQNLKAELQAIKVLYDKALKDVDKQSKHITFLKEQNKYLIVRNISIEEESRDKAIDDFVKYANTMPTVEDAEGYIRPMHLEEIAEQLKGGKNDEIMNGDY